MTELVPTDPSSLHAQMDYAKAVSTAALLPQAYRGKPADILIATGLGNAIGIAPAQALYEIYVVNGRPSPSANLMAALVRRAGHKLRVQGDNKQCTATLIRADDPDFPFAATWTIQQAKDAGLAHKDTWKQYPGAMLRARAIAEVVRMGAPEAVMGMEYAREEVEQFEDRPSRPASAKPQGMAGLRAAVGQPEPTEPTDPDVTEGELEPEPISDKTRRRLFALFTQKGVAEDQQLAGINYRLGTSYTSRKELTEDDGQALIKYLVTLPDAEPGNASDGTNDEQEEDQ